MNRNRLLMAVATAALIAGTGGAFAQQEPRGAAEKDKPAASSVTKPATGASQQLKSEQAPKSEASKPQSGRSQTTGQAPPSNAGSNQPAEHKTGEIKAQEKAGEKAVDKKAGEIRERATTGQNERTNRGDRERSTTGQATPNERRDTDRVNRNERRDNVERDRNPGDRDRVQGERNENRTTITEGREGRSTTNVHVDLSPEQRTRIHEVIVKERSAPRVANVNFSLEVGTRVPRTVRLVRLPSTIVEIEPEWRGFEYFLVGDDIVVVDPRRMEIVAVIPV
jgi:Protein of unknown function (DUF1236)